MNVPVRNVAVDIYKPNNDSSPAVTIPGSDVGGHIEITRRIQAWKDIATIDLSSAGDYAGEVTRGDKVVFDADMTEASYAASTLGGASFGASSFGGLAESSDAKHWVGLAHPPNESTRGAGLVSMSIPMSDFVFQVMSDRRVYNAFEDRHVATGDDADPGIIDELMDDLAPELSRDGIDPVAETASYEFDGADMLEAVLVIAREHDCIMASAGDALVFKEIGTISASFDLTPSDFGTLTKGGSDSDLVNDLRVDGAEDSNVDEAQETLTTYRTVSDANRIVHELDPDKSRIDHVEVWTRPIDGSESGVRVRIQQANSGNTGPIAPNDESLDIQAKQLSHHFLAEDDFTTFLLPREPLPPNPWLIIEGDRSGGQDIGVDGSGAPTHRTYYPFPIAVRLDDADSIDEFRRVMDREKRDDITDFAQARRFGDGIINHEKRPDETLTFDAHSFRAHMLDPGDAVTADYPEIGVDGVYVVTEVADTYDADRVTVETDVTMQEIDTL